MLQDSDNNGSPTWLATDSETSISKTTPTVTTISFFPEPDHRPRQIKLPTLTYQVEKKQFKNQKSMKANISIGECIIRVFLGMVFAAVIGGLIHSPLALIGVLAIYPIVTGLGGWDPIYAMRAKHTNEDSPYEDGAHGAPAAPVSRSRSEVNRAA